MEPRGNVRREGEIRLDCRGAVRIVSEYRAYGHTWLVEPSCIPHRSYVSDCQRHHSSLEASSKSSSICLGKLFSLVCKTVSDAHSVVTVVGLVPAILFPTSHILLVAFLGSQPRYQDTQQPTHRHIRLLS